MISIPARVTGAWGHGAVDNPFSSAAALTDGGVILHGGSLKMANQDPLSVTITITSEEAEEILIGLHHRNSQKSNIGYNAELGERLSRTFEKEWGWMPGLWERMRDNNQVIVTVKAL